MHWISGAAPPWISTPCCKVSDAQDFLADLAGVSGQGRASARSAAAILVRFWRFCCKSRCWFSVNSSSVALMRFADGAAQSRPKGNCFIHSVLKRLFQRSIWNSSRIALIPWTASSQRPLKGIEILRVRMSPSVDYSGESIGLK